MSLLVLKDLSTGFPQRPLMKNVCLDFNKPAFVAVVGHNGSGKTTFFKSLLCQHPYRGEIYIRGREIRSIPNLPSTGFITLLEQKNTINFNIPVKDLIVMGRFRKKSFFQNYTEEDYAEVKKVLETLHLSHIAEEDYFTLSGGEQQLVWLAQVILQDTEIVLLDEPTQQLDVYNKKKVFTLMQTWAKENKKLVICITHDIANLHEVEGYILNLSMKSPMLQIITEETIKANLQVLEKSIERG